MRILPALLLAVCSIFGPPATADDAGLVTARLQESDPFAYVLEVDLPARLQGSISPPLLPETFSNGEAEYIARGSLLKVRYPFHGERALDADDVILLPWLRNGVRLHAQWADGSRHSALFTYGLDGILLDISQIKPQELHHSEQLYQNFISGFSAAAFNWKLWLPLLCIVLLLPRSSHCLWMIPAGFAAAILLADFNLPPIGKAFGTGAMLLAVLITARVPERRPAAVFGLASLVLGLAFFRQDDPQLRIAALFGTLLFFGGGGTLLLSVRRWMQLPASPAVTSALLGAAAVTGLLQILQHQPPVPAARTGRAVDLRPVPAQRSASAAREMSGPLEAFLVIEPYETRLEIMASARFLAQELNDPAADRHTLAVAAQPVFIQQAVQLLSESFSMTMNDIRVIPTSSRANFLTLGRTGILPRTEAVPERLDTAALGLTWVFTQTAPPQNLNLAWSNLPGGLERLPLFISTPARSDYYVFSEERLFMNWSAAPADFPTYETTRVAVHPPEWSPLTFVLLIAALIFLRKPAAAYACITLSLLIFPLVRIPRPFAMPMDQQQTAAVAEQLLTNIYHAFDFREETAIYDQLAISVTGDVLTEIYLDQRRALELENRGGARARVESVQVEDIHSLRQSGGDIAATVTWNVSGSVNHFGHTHSRRNAYKAGLRMSAIDGAWKISAIEVHDEERVY